MMEHHKGAVTMVEELHRQPGTAYDPAVFNFTNDVVSDQNAEISRMNAVLAGLSNDPRATLAAGFRDAGQAISNLRLVAAMPRSEAHTSELQSPIRVSYAVLFFKHKKQHKSTYN